MKQEMQRLKERISTGKRTVDRFKLFTNCALSIMLEMLRKLKT